MIDFKKEIEVFYDDLIKDLDDLVSVNSVLDLTTAKDNQPFGEANRLVLDKMLAIGKRDGFETKDVDGYAGHIDIGNGDECIAVLGHLDVVPVNDTGWDTPPFKLTEANGCLFGRGTSDDKGPLLAAYYAAKILNDSNLELNKKIRVIFGCNEESGSKCMKYYFTKESYPSMGFTPDANFPVVYGEKKSASFTIKGTMDNDTLISFQAGTVANIVPETAVATIKGTKADYENSFNKFLIEKNLKGSLDELDGNTVVTLIGKSSHASLPHLGKNAITYLFEYLATIIKHPLVDFMDQYFSEDFYAKKLGFDITGQMGPLTLNVGILNYVNKEISIVLDLRCPHELDEKNMIDIMSKALEPYQLYEEHRLGSHLFVDPNSKLIQGLHKAYIDCTNDINAVPQAIGGGTYAKTMPNCVAFGPEFPNTDNQIHQNNEFVKIDDLKKTIEIYANALYNLAK